MHYRILSQLYTLSRICLVWPSSLDLNLGNITLGPTSKNRFINKKKHGLPREKVV